MQTLQHSYRGLSLMVELNWDRLMFMGTITVALLLGAYLGNL